MNLANALNTAWMWKCRPELRAFQRATGSVAETQAALLRQILLRNRASQYGIQHGFATIRTPTEFQERVPLSSYDTYAEFIQRIAAGESNVLTHEPILLLEPTSGTSSGEKLIPYTASLRGQFQCAVAAWIGNLMESRPEIRQGRAYWSISPAFAETRKTPAGIPIGFDNDMAYLGNLERHIIKHLLVVPTEISCVREIDNFRYCTLFHLLRARDLSLISIWSPTFLTMLLDSIENWSDRICFDLRHGSVSLPTPVTTGLPKSLCPNAKSDVLRSHQLELVLKSKLSLPEKLEQIWPQLKLISCWTDAAASHFLPELRQLFPFVEIQPKGLLATEGCVSFPLVGRTGAALALRSHFFEFEETPEGLVEEPQKCRLAHELEPGGRYGVVLTTGGGLYRYRLRDVVEVVGFERGCPLVVFCGRSDTTSDLVGEKLSEPHVRAVLERTFAEVRITPRFALVVPVATRTPRYRLYLQLPSTASLRIPSDEVAARIQFGLEENPYYRYAVKLGQLGRLDVRLLDPHGKSGWLTFERRCMANGQKPGDIKPAVLDSRSGWPEAFEPNVQHRGVGNSPAESVQNAGEASAPRSLHRG